MTNRSFAAYTAQHVRWQGSDGQGAVERTGLDFQHARQTQGIWQTCKERLCQTHRRPASRG